MSYQFLHDGEGNLYAVQVDRDGYKGACGPISWELLDADNWPSFDYTTENLDQFYAGRFRVVTPPPQEGGVMVARPAYPAKGE